MNRIVVLQPSYLPWLGFFDQINRADIFVFLDDAQYSKGDWINRNKIKNIDGEWFYLTVPVLMKGFFLSKINEVKIDYKNNWIKKHINSLSWNYRKTQFFLEIFSLLQKSILKNTELIVDVNIDLILLIAEYLGIKNCKFLRSSQIDIEPFANPTDRLIKICKKLKATNYLTGAVAKDYLHENLFVQNNIILEYQDYKHPIYKQFGEKFIPYLSIVDLLFNEGKRSLDIISNYSGKSY